MAGKTHEFDDVKYGVSGMSSFLSDGVGNLDSSAGLCSATQHSFLDILRSPLAVRTLCWAVCLSTACKRATFASRIITLCQHLRLHARSHSLRKMLLIFDTCDERDELMKENESVCEEYDMCFPNHKKRQHANGQPHRRCFLEDCVCEYYNTDGTFPRL